MGKERSLKTILLFSIGLFVTVAMHIALWYHYSINQFSPVLLIFSICFEVVFITISVVLLISYEKLKQQAIRDSMTQIYNWKFIKDSLDVEIERFKRTGQRFGVIYFDIDDFKNLNTEYGHYTGDQALLEVVEIVKSIIRPYDIFGRMGGEEFCVILPEINQDAIIKIAERIRSKIERTRINRKIPITVSVGVTLVREDDTYYSIYERSDQMMFDAKNAGKNRVIFQ